MIEALGAVHITTQRQTGIISIVGDDVALELLHIMVDSSISPIGVGA